MTSPEPKKYILSVTAGPTRDITTHQTVRVNGEEPVTIETPAAEVKLWVRIRDYRGLPPGSPETSPYFEHAAHKDDRYSIEFHFRLKDDTDLTSIDQDRSEKSPSEEEKSKADEDKDTQDHEEKSSETDNTTAITGEDVVFGNDFDRPIRDKLPPGFATAFRIVKWFLDPGLDGDVNADKPYLFGPLLSSINAFEIGKGLQEGDEEEGADEKSGENDSNDGGSKDSKNDIGVTDVSKDGKNSTEESNLEGQDISIVSDGSASDNLSVREKLGMPSDGKQRMKHFLSATWRQEFIFERGREYRCDFFNPYLDFTEFALRLPGFTLNIMRYWDGQPLRYVLKNRKTDTVYFAVSFDLLEVDEQGELLAGGEADGLDVKKNVPGLDDGVD